MLRGAKVTAKVVVLLKFSPMSTPFPLIISIIIDAWWVRLHTVIPYMKDSGSYSDRFFHAPCVDRSDGAQHDYEWQPTDPVRKQSAGFGRVAEIDTGICFGNMIF